MGKRTRIPSWLEVQLVTPNMERSMCVNPHRLPNGSLVGCRYCLQCRERKISDWEGRCIAETKMSVAASSITLTYGEWEGKKDHVRAAVLTYSDVQKYIKRLRKSGFPCSYFAVGEYGSKKGRAHWHIIIFWHERMPEVPMRQNINEKHWPHGYSFWDEANAGSVRYVCKYLVKDTMNEGEKLEAQGHLAMSKKPPLGARYFAQLAQQYVDAGLAPQNLFYGWSDIRQKNGKMRRYLLASRSAELFLQEYLMRWRGLPTPWGAHGPPRNTGRPWHYPASELVEEFEDKTVREWQDASRLDAEIIEKHALKRAKKWQDAEKSIQTDIIPPPPPHIVQRYIERNHRPV